MGYFLLNTQVLFVVLIVVLGAALGPTAALSLPLPRAHTKGHFSIATKNLFLTTNDPLILKIAAN